MNVLLASDANVERAGVCLFMLQWIENIKSLDKDIYVCAYFRKGIIDEAIADQYKELGVDLVLGELPQSQTSTSYSNRNRVKSDIRTILTKKKYDVIHVNSSALGFSSIVLTEGLKASVPIRISHSHGRNINSKVKNAYLWFLKRYNKMIATKYAGCSIDAGEYLFGKGIVKDSRWIFVPNTISAKKYQFSEEERIKRRNQLMIQDDVFLLGATGLLDKRKNHQFLIKIVKALRDQKCNFNLIVLGEGELREYLQRMIEEYELTDNVFLYGSSNEVSGWLSAMDAYLMPSLTEGLPIGAVEAQANGLSCILSDCVPPDVDICSDVYHLPINQGIDIWVKTILSIKKKTTNERKEGVKTITNAGFDKSHAALYIKKLYEIR